MTSPDSSSPLGGNAPRGPHLVLSVDRALRLVSLVAEGPPEGLSLTEISLALRLSKSSTLATARTLAAHGYLRGIEPGPRYKLGPVLITLGDLTVRQLPLGDMYRPILRELADATEMTTRVALSDHGYPVFIERIDGPGSIRFHTPLGRREPPHATAAGKAILAALPEDEVLAICEQTGLPSHTRNTITEPAALLEELNMIRRRGWAIDDEEDVAGVFCIGAAFFNHSNVCVGALSVTGIKVDLPARRAEALGTKLRQKADNVSDLLGGLPYSRVLAGGVLPPNDTHRNHLSPSPRAPRS